MALGVAILLVVGYSYLVDVPEARADYTEFATYYYTSDHIGRPLSLRDGDKDLRWYEQHYPFGDSITEVTQGSTMYAGSGNYQVSWKPNFRFPGQYEDPDMGVSYTGRPFFVQNHYREYMPTLGRYNRVDPYLSLSIEAIKSSFDINPILSHLPQVYSYGKSSPLDHYDMMGLDSCSSCCSGVRACVYNNCMVDASNWMLAIMAGMVAGGAVAGQASASAAANTLALDAALTPFAQGVAVGAGVYTSYCVSQALAIGWGCSSGCDPCYGCNSNDFCQWDTIHL